MKHNGGLSRYDCNKLYLYDIKSKGNINYKVEPQNLGHLSFLSI